MTTDGLETMSPLIEDIFERHASAADPTSERVLMACENDPGRAYNALRSELVERGVECPATVVNRLCHEPREEMRPGARVVCVDEQAEWVIEDSEAQAIQALDELGCVRLVGEARPYKRRKLWMVNGPHLALAVDAYKNGRRYLRDMLETEAGRARIEELHRLTLKVVEDEFPGLPGNPDYGPDHILAWSRHRDETARVMKRLKRQDLSPLFKDVRLKLGPAAQRFGRSSPAVAYTFEALHELVCDFSSYLDKTEIEKAHDQGRLLLDAAVDDQALRLYGELLTPWLPDAEVRVKQLSVALAGHRRVV